HRTAQIHSMVRGIEFGIEAHDGADSPFHVREMMRLMNARVLAEVEWARQFIARLEAGEYATADDPEWQPSSKPARAPRPRPRRSAPVERPAAKRDRNGRGEPVKRGGPHDRPRRARAARGAARGPRREPTR